MKIICINNIDSNICNTNTLTIGKTYVVIRITDNGYTIVDDTNTSRTYYQNRFRLLSELRDDKLNEILN